MKLDVGQRFLQLAFPDVSEPQRARALVESKEPEELLVTLNLERDVGLTEQRFDVAFHVRHIEGFAQRAEIRDRRQLGSAALESRIRIVDVDDRTIARATNAFRSRNAAIALGAFDPRTTMFV